MPPESAAQEQAAKDEAAAFAAGFQSEIGGTTNNAPEPAPAPAAAPPAVAAPAAPDNIPPAGGKSQEAEKEPKEPKPDANDEAALLAAVAEDFGPEQIKALFEKAAQVDTLRGQFNKLAGTLGSLKEDVVKLKTVPAKPAAAEAPAVDLSEFDAQYPEFAARINEALKTVNPAEIQQAVNDLAFQLEEHKLTTRHSDWRDVLNSAEYQTWLGTQTQEVQKVAMETPSADELAGVIGSYKDFTKTQDKGAKNRKRLEEAVVPTVPTAGPARAAEPTEDDMFRQGFASIANRK